MSSSRVLKPREGLSSQADRRESFLQKKRENRLLELTRLREVVEKSSAEQDDGMKDVSSSGERMENGVGHEDAEVEHGRAAASKQSMIRRKKFYSNKLMLSEELSDIPDDLSENWLVQPCPPGERCLVIASHGKTAVRSVDGNLIGRFPSLLPNGSYQSRSNKIRTEKCVLDCLRIRFPESCDLFCVLDALCWKGYPLYDCDTSFRKFWIVQKLEEHAMDVASVAPSASLTQNKFVSIPSFKANNEGIHMCIQYLKEQFRVENVAHRSGVIFIHTAAHYTPGHSPLMCFVSLESISSFFSEAFFSMENG